MYEDPFDPLSSSIFTVVMCIGGLLDFMSRRLWLLVRYLVGISWIHAKHWFTLTHLSGRKVWMRLYYMHIRVWLEVYGLVSPLTWADVETYRLHLNAKWGREFQRPEGLEEAFLREQQHLS